MDRLDLDNAITQARFDGDVGRQQDLERERDRRDDEARHARAPNFGGGGGAGYRIPGIFLLTGLPVVPLAVIGAPVMWGCLALMRRLSSDGELGVKRAYVAAFHVLHVWIVMAVAVVILNQVLGGPASELLKWGPPAGVVIGARMLSTRCEAFDDGFLGFLGGCVAALLVSVVTFGAVAVGMMLALGLGTDVLRVPW